MSEQKLSPEVKGMAFRAERQDCVETSVEDLTIIFKSNYHEKNCISLQNIIYFFFS